MTRSFVRSLALQSRLHDLVPGGSHTYAKGDDQYPERMPVLLVRGRGCHVWDVDDNEYIEYGMGLRAVALGHAFPDVVDAVAASLANGTNFARPALLELEAAEALCGLLETPGMVKFAKNGSDVTTAAVRLARAWTGRDLVAVSAGSPFYSTDDWFIGRTPMNAGIPAAISDLTVSFGYNDLASLETLFREHPGRIACVVMEAATATLEPEPGFLEGCRRLCDEQGALLIFDEMITGFRWHRRGAQGLYGITPDLSAFGKALGNGFAVSALVGRREVMELGGLRHDRDRVFLLSTTHGAEAVGLAAAMAVIDVYERQPVIETLERQGSRLADGVTQAARRHGLQEHVVVRGHPSNLVYATLDAAREPSQAFRTLFLQELLRRGVLAPSFVVSYSHSDEDIDMTVDLVDEALAVYVRALSDGVEQHLEGRPVQPVMRRRNGAVFGTSAGP
jgi:glutamate-1-semialdehyde 2,1-aminomutase